MTDIQIGVGLDAAVRRADARAEADGYHIATVGHIVAEIAEAEGAVTKANRSLLLGTVESEELRAEADGASITYVVAQRERVMESAMAYASASGSDCVQPVHFVVASFLTVGDQLAGHYVGRLAVARVARSDLEGSSWVSLSLGTRSHLVGSARARSSAAMDRYRSLRWAGAGVSGYRFVMTNFRAGVTIATLWPGLLIREALWAILAWLNGSNRRPFSHLGVGQSSGLTKVPETRARLRMEVVVSFACLALGSIAMAAWLLPQTLLGRASTSPLMGYADEQLIAWGISNGGGVLDLGPWVPWALLAVAIPEWGVVLRLEWTSRLVSGPLTRAYLRTLYALAAVARPIDVVLSPLGLPAIVGRGLVILLVMTLAVRQVT